MEKRKTPGQLIREDLQRLACTQTQLAQRLYMDYATLSKLVNDKQAMTPERARTIANTTGRDPWEYFEAQARLWFENNATAQMLNRVGGDRRPRRKKAVRRSRKS